MPTVGDTITNEQQEKMAEAVHAAKHQHFCENAATYDGIIARINLGMQMRQTHDGDEQFIEQNCIEHPKRSQGYAASRKIAEGRR